MRRVLAVSLLALAASRGARAQSVSARVGGELTGFPGSYVAVPIAVDMSAAGGAMLGSYTARLQWNPAVLYFQDVLSGNFPAPQLNYDSLGAGVLRFTAISPAGVDGLVSLVQFRYYIADTTSSLLDLSFSEMSAAQTFVDLTPSLTVTSATFCGARGRWGDLDRDTRANSRDALVILSSVVGYTVNADTFDLTVGDVDGDLKTNSRDALIILSYAVGIDIPGQRVLLPVPAGCGTGAARQLTVFPPAAELAAPRQELRLLVRAVDGSGRAVTVPDAVWRSSDYTVAHVDASGLVTPRGPGTATITAEVAPGLRASATITVIGRRANWYVDLRATGAPFQLGTMTVPFEHPTMAYDVVGEGDTIRVASGTYFFDDDGDMETGAIILGGTPGDTTTRPVFLDPQANYYALNLNGGQRTVVRNIEFRNFYEAAELDGVRNFAMEDVKVIQPDGGSGIYHCGGAMDTVRIDRSVFLGDSVNQYGEAIYYSGCAIIGITIVRDTKIRFWGDGLYLYDADSTAIIRSEISDNDGYGISISQEYDENPSLYIAHSRIERNYYEAIEMDYARRLVVDTSVIRATEDDVFDVYGECCSPFMQVYLHGDSIYFEADDYDWMDASYVDTLVIDQTVVRMPADTALYMYSYIEADKAFVTNSKFLNIGYYGESFYFYGSEALFDNVDFTGCNVANCDTGYGPELYAENDVVNVQIQNSRFSKLYYAVDAEDGDLLRFTGNTVDSTLYGLYLQGDSVIATGNVITRAVYRGVYVDDQPARGPAVLSGNSVTCAPYAFGQQGLYLSSGAVVLQADTVTNCRQGIYVSGVSPGTVIQRNVVRNPVHGMYVSQGDTMQVRLLGNAISGADTSAVYVAAGRVLLRGNNIRDNERDGLFIPFATTRVSVADSNAFVNNTRYAVYAPSDSVDARYNWWGLATGPGTGAGADSVSGVRVVTSDPLVAEPGGLPGLAPPAARIAAARVAADASAVVTERPARSRVRAPKAPRSAASVSVGGGPAAERHAARAQVEDERRAAREAREVERQSQRDTRRAAATAERAVRRAAPQSPQ